MNQVTIYIVLLLCFTYVCKSLPVLQPSKIVEKEYSTLQEIRGKFITFVPNVPLERYKQTKKNLFRKGNLNEFKEATNVYTK